MEEKGRKWKNVILGGSLQVPELNMGIPPGSLGMEGAALFPVIAYLIIVLFKIINASAES